jgi:hypothetical protein
MEAGQDMNKVHVDTDPDHLDVLCQGRSAFPYLVRMETEPALNKVHVDTDPDHLDVLRQGRSAFPDLVRMEAGQDLNKVHVDTDPDHLDVLLQGRIAGEAAVEVLACKIPDHLVSVSAFQTHDHSEQASVCKILDHSVSASAFPYLVRMEEEPDLSAWVVMVVVAEHVHSMATN